MKKITAVFLYAFLLDGVLSTADLLSRHAAPGMTGSALAMGLSIGVLALGIVLFAGMMITPRLPKRLLMPPILFLAVCIVCGVMFGDSANLTLSIAEVILGVAMIAYAWERPGPVWRMRDFTAGRPFFTFKNFFLMGAMCAAICACVAVLIALSFTEETRLRMERFTGNYMTIHPEGISLAERRFRKGDQEIRLIGMMHVAKSGFYDDVAKNLPAGSSAIVLLEGVSDRQHLLGAKFGYGKLATWLGFTSQDKSSFTKKAAAGLAEADKDAQDGTDSGNLTYKVADVDLADLKPATVRFIGAIGVLLSSANLHDALEKYPLQRQALEDGSTSAYEDILETRNAHLLGEMTDALKTHSTVVVPWGAGHMPGIQKAITRWGFVQTTNGAERQAVSFHSRGLIAFIWLLDRVPAREE